VKLIGFRKRFSISAMLRKSFNTLHNNCKNCHFAYYSPKSWREFISEWKKFY